MSSSGRATAHGTGSPQLRPVHGRGSRALRAATRAVIGSIFGLYLAVMAVLILIAVLHILRAVFG